MRTRVFRNEQTENNLQKNGFVKIPFWNQQIVALVNQKFNDEFESAHTSTKKFHTTYETTNVGLIKKVNSFLQPLFLEETENLFCGMQRISAGFLLKQIGENSDSPLHQDAQFVDEPKHSSVSVWVALQDCDDSNSCLQFVPGSHHLFTGIRYIPFTNRHIEPHSPSLKLHLTNHRIKAGEAFVFYNATLHTSGENKSDRLRLAAVMGFYSEAAQMSLYFKNEKANCIERYAVNMEELSQINSIFKPQAQQFISSYPIPEMVSSKEVELFLKKRKTTNIFSRLFNRM